MEFVINTKNRGDFIVEIDEEDYERVSSYKWHACFANKHSNLPYVQTRLKNQKTLYLHRLLLPDAKIIDHKDGNPLNNKKSNLRACTKAQNGCNRKAPTNNKSGYKGVFILERKYKEKTYVSIQASIEVEQNHIYLGTFKTVEDAALAYNKAAVKFHGEFAKLNRIESRAV